MEIFAIITIIFLLGYIVFKDVLYHRHLEKLEKQLLAKTIGDTTVLGDSSIVDPDRAKNTIAEEEHLTDIDEMPNPFMRGK